MKNYKLTLFLMLFFLPQLTWASPQTGQTYFSGSNNGTALAVDPTHQKLYYAANKAINLYIFDLDGSGNPTGSTNTKVASGTFGLALNTEAQKLYLANSNLGGVLVAISLDGNGNIQTSYNYNNFTNDATCVALNPVDQCLYLGLLAGSQSLAVYRLDASGLPQTPPSSYDTGGDVHALAMDMSHRKLYIGRENGQIGVCDIGASGVPSTFNFVSAGASGITTLALDTVKGKLYAGSASDTKVYAIDLDGNGNLSAVGTPQNLGAGNFVDSLMLDAVRSVLYVGSTNNLYWYNLDQDGGFTTGPNSIGSGTGVSSLAMDAQKQRLYTAASINDYYYPLSDAAMPPLRINAGAANTTSTAVNLEWALPNAQFIRVESSSDLVSFNFPNTITASGSFDQWLPAGADSWSNTPNLRANPLIVPAELTTGANIKTVTVWFWESTGASNPTGQMRKEMAQINLQSTGSSPTFTPTDTLTPSPTPSFTKTPSQTPTPTFSGTPTFTFTITDTPSNTASPTFTDTKTQTPSPTPSPTPTFTNTLTVSATYTRTSSPTFTPSQTPELSPTSTPALSPTPSATATPTLTISATLTPSASYTRTSTVSPTLTRTPTLTQSATWTITPSVTRSATITKTVPPTKTPTPAAIFYLNQNHFNPAMESLQVHLELLPLEKAAITIYSLKGRKITSYEESTVAGRQLDLAWDGRNQNGETVASGLYYVVLESSKRKVIKKVLVIK